MSEIHLPPDCDLERLPRLNPELMGQRKAQHYRAYASALTAVYQGESTRQAAKNAKVRRETLADIVAESLRMHPDGTLVGYRACAYHHIRVRDDAPGDALTRASTRPKTLRAMLRSLAPAAQLLARFRGRLPERHRPSLAFDRCFKKLMVLLKAVTLDDLPLWQSPDRGRRAVLRYLRQQRQLLPAPDLEDPAPGEEHGTRQDHLFALKPLDRVELDAHPTDVRWHALIRARDGGWMVRAITRIWIIVLIDAASRAILSWHLVVGASFTQWDVLRAVTRSLIPWRKRELIVPGLHYHPDAWMPSMASEPAQVLRALVLAMDNAMANVAHNVMINLPRFFRGVINLGFPHIPEGRCHIEAFFKKLENMLFRQLAGGFRPASSDGTAAEPTTGLDPRDHPVQLHALEDLIDVAVSAYNATEQDGLDQRSPRQVFERYFGTAVGARSALTADDITQLLTLRFQVVFHGKKNVRSPYVKWMGGIYRSPSLYRRYKLINQRFAATVPANDLRRMSIWNDGELYVVLHVTGPWAHTAHDFETRQRAERCRRRGLVSWAGVDDAVAAFQEAVREWAAEKLKGAADECVRMGATDTPPRAAPKKSSSSPLFTVQPRRRR